jgi:neutral trehalase
MVTWKMPKDWLTGSCICELLNFHLLSLIDVYSTRMTVAVVDFNGVVPEKFDAVKLSHMVDAEYGNQGIDFKMVPREGFGWMNCKLLG